MNPILWIKRKICFWSLIVVLGFLIVRGHRISYITYALFKNSLLKTELRSWKLNSDLPFIILILWFYVTNRAILFNIHYLKTHYWKQNSDLENRTLILHLQLWYWLHHITNIFWRTFLSFKMMNSFL